MKTCAPKKSLGLIIGKSLLYASLQFAVGSVEMSSKFSVKNFATDQITLNHAADALTDYILVAIVWTIGATLVMFAGYGTIGLVSSLFANSAIVAWITVTYISSFKYACNKHGLIMPNLFRKRKD